MTLFNKITYINELGQQLRVIRLLNSPLIMYFKGACSHFFFSYKNTLHTGSPFFIKANRNSEYLILCLQKWIDIAAALNRKIVLICDNKQTLDKIKKRIKFHDPDIEIVSSIKGSVFSESKKMLDECWIKAACAHRTTFFYAKKYKADRFWNIDGDDTLLCIDTIKAAEIIVKAEQYAEQNKLDAFSYDMWCSNSRSVHWSFGITYLKNRSDWEQIFAKFANKSWHNKYKVPGTYMNIDWLFTHLRNIKAINAGVFAVENLFLIHWGDFIRNCIASNISIVKNNQIIYPISKYILKRKDLEEVPLWKETVKLEIAIDEEDSQNYLASNVALNFSL